MGDPQVNQGDALATRKAAAEARVRAALDAIQEAQGLVDRAAQALCSVKGVRAAHERLGRLYDQVHLAWYVVRDAADSVRHRGALLLDHEPGACEAEWEARS
jgi:hypothetical protein